ncbi:MAG: GNAT family N-acetyltransferase [Acidimicrobiaceae bacterium]|nr:GNAT family N-acetyltransferase [Acidimicrobiaceae bacterium]
MFEYEIERATDTRLRLITHYDSFALFNLIDSDREHLGEFLSWVHDTKSIEDTDNFVTNCLLQLTTGTGFVTGMVLAGKLVGVIGFQPINFESLTVDLGYWIHSDYQGLGVVTKSTVAMTTIAFTRMGLQTVTITADQRNIRSRAIPERLGFQPESELEVEGSTQIVYAMKRSAWIGERNGPTDSLDGQLTA